MGMAGDKAEAACPAPGTPSAASEVPSNFWSRQGMEGRTNDPHPAPSASSTTIPTARELHASERAADAAAASATSLAELTVELRSLRSDLKQRTSSVSRATGGQEETAAASQPQAQQRGGAAAGSQPLPVVAILLTMLGPVVCTATLKLCKKAVATLEQVKLYRKHILHLEAQLRQTQRQRGGNTAALEAQLAESTTRTAELEGALAKEAQERKIEHQDAARVLRDQRQQLVSKTQQYQALEVELASTTAALLAKTKECDELVARASKLEEEVKSQAAKLSELSQGHLTQTDELKKAFAANKELRQKLRATTLLLQAATEKNAAGAKHVAGEAVEDQENLQHRVKQLADTVHGQRDKLAVLSNTDAAARNTQRLLREMPAIQVPIRFVRRRAASGE